LHSVDLTLTHP